jgi:hypothetical protein
MSDYKFSNPANEKQLNDAISALLNNKSHVKGIRFDEPTNAILIDLDFAAHATGHPNMLLRTRRGKGSEVTHILDLVRRDVDNGRPVTNERIHALFDLLDHGAAF